MSIHRLAIGVAAFLFLTLSATAQIPVGEALVLTQDAAGVRGMVSIATGGPSAPTGVGPLSPVLAGAALTCEIAPASGDIIVISEPTTGGTELEVYRLTLSGYTVTSESLLFTLPGSSNTVGSMQREASGAMLVSCKTSTGGTLIFRIIVSPVGAALQAVPVTFPSGNFLALASHADGTIYTCDWFPASGFSSTVYSVGPNGGTFTSTGITMPLSAADLAVDTSGTIHGGGYPTSLLGPNYFCGGAAFTFPATNPPFSDVVQDIGRDDTGNVYAAVANPGAATIYQIAGCMPPGTALAVLPGVFVGKISLPSAILAFGNSCPNSLGLLPTIATVGTPVAGGSWTLDITNAIPNNVAFGVFGRDPISPLNIGSTNGCFLVISRILVLAAPVDGLGNATLTVNLPPALSGLPLFAQWAFRDAALNPIGIGLTSGLRVNL